MDENKNLEGQLSDREKELVEKIANLEQDKANLVGEIQETRAQKIARENELKNFKETIVKKEDNSDPEQIVERVLSKRAQEASEKNFELAKSSFKEQVKEFSKDVDQAGILFSKFEREMSKFNFNGLNTQEDYLSRLREVYEFTNRGKQPDARIEFHKGSPSTLGTDPHSSDGANLSSAEAKLIKEMNLSKDQFLKIKAKRPHYVANLLKYRSV